MDQKILFIADYLRDTYSHTELCVRYGISRKTGYKWLARYQQYELDGLVEYSQIPLLVAAELNEILKKLDR